jgi:hypothetical protein
MVDFEVGCDLNPLPEEIFGALLRHMPVNTSSTGDALLPLRLVTRFIIEIRILGIVFHEADQPGVSCPFRLKQLPSRIPDSAPVERDRGSIGSRTT